MNRKISSAGSREHRGLRLVIALIGDLGTIFATVTVVVNTPLPVTAVLVLILGAAALFVAHEVRLRLRAARMPAVLATLLTVVCRGRKADGSAAAARRRHIRDVKSSTKNSLNQARVRLARFTR